MNTNNPKKEFKRLNEMTKNNPDDRDFRDIFVRCAGFYKIETTLEKTITTSSFTPFEDLPEYLKRGWDVCIIPPIIVNSEKGIISELDMNSLLVERYLERYLEKYDKVKESGYGRIYRKLPHQKPVRQNF
jgi:intein/homing endonuclease